MARQQPHMVQRTMHPLVKLLTSFEKQQVAMLRLDLAPVRLYMADPPLPSHIKAAVIHLHAAQSIVLQD